MSLLVDHRCNHVAKFYVRVRSVRRGLKHFLTSSFGVSNQLKLYFYMFSTLSVLASFDWRRDKRAPISLTSLSRKLTSKFVTFFP